MPHSYSKIWIHAIWATKHREPLILPDVEEKIYQIMKDEIKSLKCSLRSLNGMPDHVHILFRIHPQQSIADVIKQIKGSSSHRINQINLTHKRFAWQTGYGAFSVSESLVERVNKYIKNQKQHHIKRRFQEEYDHFLRLHSLF
jgi:REP element-mobilizing transposase RayT